MLGGYKPQPRIQMSFRDRESALYIAERNLAECDPSIDRLL